MLSGVPDPVEVVRRQQLRHRQAAISRRLSIPFSMAFTFWMKP
jgi:hypothetical protein